MLLKTENLENKMNKNKGRVGKDMGLLDFLHPRNEETNSFEEQEDANDSNRFSLSERHKRHLLDEVAWIICPICREHQDIEDNRKLDGK